MRMLQKNVEYPYMDGTRKRRGDLSHICVVTAISLSLMLKFYSISANSISSGVRSRVILSIKNNKLIINVRSFIQEVVAA